MRLLALLQLVSVASSSSHLRYMTTFGDQLKCNSLAAAQKAGWANLCVCGDVPSTAVCSARRITPSPQFLVV